MPSYADDLAFGLRNQQTVRQLLNEKFGGDHVEQSRYATFDYLSSDGLRLVEVKSLRCRSDKHAYALMGGNKVDAAAAAHPNREVVFVWVYEDDIFYAKYDPVTFATFRRSGCIRSGRTGITDMEADTVWVPKTHIAPLRTHPAHASTSSPSLAAAPLPAPLAASS